MTSSTRGRTNRVANARLPVLLASPLPEEVKTGVSAVMAELLALKAADPEAVIQPYMLVRLQDLLNTTTLVACDLLHVLCMCGPHNRGFTRKALGALLRDKRSALGRDPTSADFPPNHPIQIFASAYWGGIEAWAAGAPARMQQEKGYWRKEANQLAALQSFAATHPELPITIPNLDKAGFHALCVALRRVDLGALVGKAGLGSRNLRRDPEGPAKWTAVAVLDAYIALCRTWKITLTTDGLLKLKGSASSIRGHAQRLFGSFGAMVAAARLRAPDLRPLESFIAADGTRLDSPSEVVAWNALRRALPDANFRAHVLLPGSKRSVDILINESVYVEVLMIAVADMAKPATKTKAKYATNWAEKAPLYAALDIDPVLIEPLDIYDPKRLAERIAEIGRRIGMEPLPPGPPSGAQTRAKGYWGYEALCKAVAEVAKLTGSFPTYAQLTENGYGHATRMLRQRGMRKRVADTLGLRLINSRGVWPRSRIIAELLAWVEEHGQYPSVPELIEAKRSDLLGAIHRLGRGKAEVIRAEVETLWGKPMRRRRMQDGSYATLASIGSLLRPLAERIGRVPTRRECAAEGLGTAWDVMSRRWGVAALGAHLDLPTASEGRRKPTGPRLL